MFIGNVEIPIINNIESLGDIEFDEIQPTNTKTIFEKHDSGLTTLIFEGFVNEEMHSNFFTLEEQKDDIRSLKKKDTIDNTINYKDWKGHLLVEDINLTDTSDSRIINEVEITARYFPWPKFYPGDEP